MGRGDRRGSTRSGGQDRTVLISKALSRLLRHQAKNENIPITAEGWVRVDHLLAWNGLHSRSKFNAPVNLDDIFDIVENNDKKRFALKHSKSELEADLQDYVHKEDEDITTVTDSTWELTLETISSEAAIENVTEKAIETFRSTDSNPSHFFIRAAQGHSMKEIETEGLLTPITVDQADSIPHTVVHGTFYGAWSSILHDGGLKKMNRNMIHFATGPALSEILPDQSAPGQTNVTETLNENKVISGMRSDAQILIYVDIKRCLEDVKACGLDMKWWRSENGVILTEGVESEPVEAVQSGDGPGQEDEMQTKGAVRKPERKKERPIEKLLPTKYWMAVVEIKAGLGILWNQELGVVKELPQHLREKGMPRGKGRGYRGSGRNKR